MRKLIGIKYWVNQCTVGSDDSHNSEVGLCPTIFQEENSKHGHTAMVKGQTNKKRKALPEVPGVKGKELNVIFNSYKTHPISLGLIVVATFLLNLGLVIVNQTIGGNYGMLKHTPFIMGPSLVVKYLAVSATLIILMIIMKKSLEYFEDKY